jgi:hypothetical protein
MFQCLNIIGYKQQDFTNLQVSELPVKLTMPAGYRDKAIPTSIVVKELLWQQYGMDLTHPEVSRWLEQNAPDVKDAAADHQFTDVDDQKETIEFHLPLEIDDRLREVSTQYFLSQIQYSIEPETQPQLMVA